MKVNFKTAISMIAFWCSFGVSAQSYVKVDAAGLGLNGSEAVALAAETKIDYTDAIVNADLATTDAWNVEGTKGIKDGMVKVGSQAVYDFSQTITLPAGQYKMTAKAVYRYGDSEQAEFDAMQAGTETHKTKLYAETATKKYEANVQNRNDGASDTDYAAGNGTVTINGKFVPNSSAAVQAWFDGGQYVNELVFDVLEDGQVKIGITTADGVAGDYVNIGAWTLIRLGDVSMEQEELAYYLSILNEKRAEITKCIAKLDSLGLAHMKELLITEYEKTNSIDETSSKTVSAESSRLANLSNACWEGIQAYNELGTFITECDSLVAERASVSFSNSIDAAKAIYNNTEIALSEDFDAAHKALVSARNLYRIENISISEFDFSYNKWNNSMVSVGDWDLTLDKTYNVVRVNSYRGSEPNVIIPETFTYGGVEYITVGIGDYTNYTWPTHNYWLQSVGLPVTLRFLGSYAFYRCNELTEIHIPSNVEIIGSSAFEACTRLSEVSLPDSLKTIDSYAFRDCRALERMTIPANVTWIGSAPFYNCPKLKTVCSEATFPPYLADNFNENIRVVYVPAGSGEAYKWAYNWNNHIIVDGEGVSANVDVETPGTLGEKLLEQVEYLDHVNYLTVSGTLNYDDIYNIQNRMTGLLTIDMSGVDMAELPAELFRDRYGLQQVVLPDSLTSIGSFAFQNCYNLQDVVFPSTLKDIEAYAFDNCDNFKHVVFPEGVTYIGPNAFSNCRSLQMVHWPSTASIINEYTFSESGVDSIIIAEGVISIGEGAFYSTDLRELICPSTLKYIHEYAFYDCSKLSQVNFNEGLESLYNGAFFNCDNLTDIMLPSTLNFCNTPFEDCNNIGTVTCLALLPPTLEYSHSIFYENNVSRVLYVPEWTVNNYKLTVGWDDFSYIEPIKAYYPEYIFINDKAALTLPDSVPNTYKPNLKIDCPNDLYNYMYSIDRYGSLILNGSGMLSVGEFQIVYNSYSTYANQRFYGTMPMTSDCSLVNNVMLRADSVEIISYHPSDVWTFLSFPYDVKVSDIVSLPENSNYVIRKYSGRDRADANLDNTWQDMTTDSILRAGEGYIWQSNNGYEDYINYWSGSAYYNEFHIPAMNNTNKNQIFANSDRTITLHEYLSEFSHNRSWNLIGNPYPSYYDARAMDFTAPFTVWDMDNKSYKAYSPIDDEYIFRPGEAFFVQRPVDTESITFAADGRQTDRVVRYRAARAKANTRSTNMRQVFNLTLSDGEMTDRTRFVINPNAACDYEMAADATKFMSSDARAAQLYTIEGDVQFAINERPMAGGIITLGAYLGSKGTYTIALDTKVESMSVILVDKVAGTETDLMEGSYTFTSEVGVADNRFEVRMRADEEDGDTSGMDNLNGKVSVKAASGQITVAAPCEAEIDIYNAEGQRIATATAASATFEVAQGVYVVKVQDTVHKVSVTR